MPLTLIVKPMLAPWRQAESGWETKRPFVFGRTSPGHGALMKRLLIMLVLCLFFVHLTAVGAKADRVKIVAGPDLHGFLDLIAVGAKSDRVKKGLLGPVRTVMTGNGNKTLSTYDVKGNEIERVFYELMDPTSPYARLVHAYDAKGNIIKTTEYNPDGSIFGKTVYTYRTKRNKTVVTSHNYDTLAELTGKEVSTFDAKGNKISDVSYYDDGSIRHKETYTYDAKGNIAEMGYYDPHGPDTATVIYTCNDRGNVTEEVWYNANGSFRGKTVYTYEYDSAGNWIKRSNFRQVAHTKSAKPALKPEGVTCRTITYYPRDERH